LDVQRIEAGVADHPNAGLVFTSGVIRSRASPATSRKEELKNPAIRSYRRAPCNRVARKSFKGLRREE